MIPHQFFYLLVVLGLLWIFFMLHVAWPTQGVTPLPVRTLPRRRRPNKPTPFAGLTQKPHCARCEHDTAHPTAPSGAPPEPVPPTHRRPRTVDTSRHFCPHRGSVGTPEHSQPAQRDGGSLQHLQKYPWCKSTAYCRRRCRRSCLSAWGLLWG